MHLFLVRHGAAGSRHKWEGPDHRRPLSAKGWRQAEGLVSILGGPGVRRVLSSPFLRCVQTVEPLAAKLGLEVESSEALAEGARTKDALALIRSLAGIDAVLCSHGDVIPGVLEALASEEGFALGRAYPCAKGSTWRLVRQDGGAMEAQYIPPPL